MLLQIVSLYSVDDEGLLYSIGGMMLTGENRRPRTETYPGATSSTANVTWTGPRPNPGLRGERPAADSVSRSTVLKTSI